MGRGWLAEEPGTKHGSTRPVACSMASQPKPGVGGSCSLGCVWGLLRSSNHGVKPPSYRASLSSPAEEGQARQAGPRAVKEKNIPRPANCCSQLFPPPPAGGEEKKKSSASSGGRCKRMQNFNHLLHQPSLPQQSLRGLGSGTIGMGLWGAHMPFL